MRHLLAFLLMCGALTACDSPLGPSGPGDPTPEDSTTTPTPDAGLFDQSPLLPALSEPGAEDWTWIPDSGMRCRDGSATGFGLRRVEGSRDLLIYLQGGGACFDLISCANNPAAYGAGGFQGFGAGAGQNGLFAQDREANPFRDWNMVFVPYCTGDLHGGDAPNRTVPGLELFGAQQFVGSSNMSAVMNRIGNAGREARQVVLTGESAGGLGSLLTYGLVADSLSPAPVDLLNDSGPFPPSNSAFPPARQQQWTSLWNLGSVLPDACASCRETDGLEHLLPHYATTYPERSFGLISYRADFVMRLYYGYYGLIEPAPFESGLFGIRPTLPSNGATYYIPGDGHTVLSSGAYYTLSVQDVPLTDWVNQIVDGGASHVPTQP